MNHQEYDERKLDELFKQYIASSSTSSSARSSRKRRWNRASDRPQPPSPNANESTEMMSPEGCMKAIKRLLRDANPTLQGTLIQRLFDSIKWRLQRTKNATIVPVLVQLTDELFTRAAAFRALVAVNTSSFFDLLLQATNAQDPPIGKGKKKMPRVRSKASTPERDAVLDMIERWKDAYGSKYPTIAAGYDMLVDQGYAFPHKKANEAAAHAQATSLRQHQANVAQLKMAQIQREMAQYTQEMEDLLVEMTRIFEILVPTLEAFAVAEAPLITETPSAETKEDNDDDDDNDVEWEQVESMEREDQDDGDESIEWEEVACEQDDQHSGDDEDWNQMDMNEIVQAYGLGSASYQLTISIPKNLCERSSENEVLFQTLADGILRIRKRFLPLASDWQQAFNAHVSITPSNDPERTSLHAKADDLHRRLEQVILQWEDLVKENERKRFARIRPTVVSESMDSYQRHPLKQNQRDKSKLPAPKKVKL